MHRVVIGLICLSWLATSSGVASGPLNEPDALVVTAEQGEQQALRARPEQRFQVRLVARPGAGESWRIATPLGRVVRQYKEPNFVPLDSGLGGRSWITFYLEAVSIGEIDIEFYRLGPGRGAPPVGKFLLKVNVL